MKIPVFLSRPEPHLAEQVALVEGLVANLRGRGLEPITLGAGSYNWQAPLVGIRQLMTSCCGLVALALRQTRVKRGKKRAGANVGSASPAPLRNVWLTSPYCHIEPAMAFQLGLPILVMREEGVLQEGIVERGVTGLYMPEFNCSAGAGYFDQDECSQLLGQWEAQVRTVHIRRGDPPRLY